MKIAQGAEAVIYHENDIVIKERIVKPYRHEAIDNKIRKRNTRKEAKLLQKASELIPVPKVNSVCDKEMKISMEFIEGKKLRDVVNELSSEERKELFKRVGKKLAILHNNDIVHGDLTTSNIIFNDKLYFIDFGLGFVSLKLEDKAVDIHLLKKALKSKHYQYSDELIEAFLEGYEKESKEFESVMTRLEKVEGRGRYKNKQ